MTSPHRCRARDAGARLCAERRESGAPAIRRCASAWCTRATAARRSSLACCAWAMSIEVGAVEAMPPVAGGPLRAGVSSAVTQWAGGGTSGGDSTVLSCRRRGVRLPGAARAAPSPGGAEKMKAARSGERHACSSDTSPRHFHPPWAND